MKYLGYKVEYHPADNSSELTVVEILTVWEKSSNQYELRCTPQGQVDYFGVTEKWVEEHLIK